jgi:hypothetical protein
MKRCVALLRPTQTRARACACAPHPAAGRSDGCRWNGDGTVHNGAAAARRRRSPACGGRHPYEPDVPSRQGGQQSGAAEDGAPKGRMSVGKPLHNERRRPKPTDRPARVAMGEIDSYTAEPDRAAACLTDMRSLAAPVFRGTSMPIAPARAPCTPADVRTPKPRFGTETRLRDRHRRVYAFRSRPRIFFNRHNPVARPVPRRMQMCTPRHFGRAAQEASETWCRGHGRNDNPAMRTDEAGRTGGSFRGGVQGTGGSRSADQGHGGPPRDHGNLGMFGKRSKNLRPGPSALQNR